MPLSQDTVCVRAHLKDIQHREVPLCFSEPHTSTIFCICIKCMFMAKCAYMEGSVTFSPVPGVQNVLVSFKM